MEERMWKNDIKVLEANFREISQSNSSLKKHRSRSIFSPFFCCFRNYNDYHVDPPPTNNKTLSLPPSPEENGSPPKRAEAEGLCSLTELAPQIFPAASNPCDQVQVIPIPSPPAKFLLPEVSIADCSKNCVVIDLDETLVHSSFKYILLLPHSSISISLSPSLKSGPITEKRDEQLLCVQSSDDGVIQQESKRQRPILSLHLLLHLRLSPLYLSHSLCESRTDAARLPPISNADFIVPVEIDGTVHQSYVKVGLLSQGVLEMLRAQRRCFTEWKCACERIQAVYVLKRPHVDEFLQKMGELFECVLFTASLAKYADPVADLLDQWGVFRARLFRESCVFHRGNYVKDLSRLGRELSKVIIIDNSPASYIFHPENAVPVQSWFDDMTDTELLDLIPLFEGLSKEEDVYSLLQSLRNR
ncbi:hypothetical protein PAMP_011165 [Pampus punctatissimus]